MPLTVAARLTYCCPKGLSHICLWPIAHPVSPFWNVLPLFSPTQALLMLGAWLKPSLQEAFLNHTPEGAFSPLGSPSTGNLHPACWAVSSACTLLLCLQGRLLKEDLALCVPETPCELHPRPPGAWKENAEMHKQGFHWWSSGLRLHAPNSGGLGSITGQGAKLSHAAEDPEQKKKYICMNHGTFPEYPCLSRSIKETLSVSVSSVRTSQAWGRHTSALKTRKPRVTLQLGPSMAVWPWWVSLDFFIYKVGRCCRLPGVIVHSSWTPRVKHAPRSPALRGAKSTVGAGPGHSPRRRCSSPAHPTWGSGHDSHPRAPLWLSVTGAPLSGCMSKLSVENKKEILWGPFTVDAMW